MEKKTEKKVNIGRLITSGMFGIGAGLTVSMAGAALKGIVPMNKLARFFVALGVSALGAKAGEIGMKYGNDVYDQITDALKVINSMTVSVSKNPDTVD